MHWFWHALKYGCYSMAAMHWILEPCLYPLYVYRLRQRVSQCGTQGAWMLQPRNWTLFNKIAARGPGDTWRLSNQIESMEGLGIAEKTCGIKFVIEFSWVECWFFVRIVSVLSCSVFIAAARSGEYSPISGTERCLAIPVVLLSRLFIAMCEGIVKKVGNSRLNFFGLALFLLLLLYANDQFVRLPQSNS